MDTFSFSPTSFEIWNMQFVQDDLLKYIQKITFSCLGMFFMFSNFYQLKVQNDVLHEQIYDEASTNIRRKIDPRLI